jgi:hypothetical protein
MHSHEMPPLRGHRWFPQRRRGEVPTPARRLGTSRHCSYALSRPPGFPGSRGHQRHAPRSQRASSLDLYCMPSTGRIGGIRLRARRRRISGEFATARQTRRPFADAARDRAAPGQPPLTRFRAVRRRGRPGDATRTSRAPATMRAFAERVPDVGESDRMELSRAGQRSAGVPAGCSSRSLSTPPTVRGGAAVAGQLLGSRADADPGAVSIKSCVSTKQGPGRKPKFLLKSSADSADQAAVSLG